MNPLLAYDFLLLSKGFAATFRTWWDLLFLLIGSAVTILWLRARMDESGLLGEPVLLAALGALLAFSFSRTVAERLAFHASESVLAPEGLSSRERRHYVLAWSALSIFPLAALGLAVGPNVPRPLTGGYLTALVFSYIVARIVRPGGMLRRLKLRRNADERAAPSVPGPLGYGSRATRSVAIVAFAAAASLLPAWVVSRPAGELTEMIVLAATILVCLGFLTRLDHATVRFLALAGRGPWRSLAILMSPAALYCAILLPLAGLVLGQGEALAIALLAALAALLMASRILTYRIHDKMRADMLLTVGWVGIGLVGAAVPPALLLAVPALGLVLLRQSASVTWSMS